MNTPAHAIVNLLVLARKPSHRASAVIVAGALIPDLAIVVFYAWHLLLGTPEQLIWSREYYAPLWQGWFDAFNSMPLTALAVLLCWATRSYLPGLLCASMLLHQLGDLPLHHDDAHRHFFPFSDWRFASPVSYWDPAHYGRWASLAEFGAVLAAAALLYRRTAELRAWALAIVALYLVYWLYVYLVWL